MTSLSLPVLLAHACRAWRDRIAIRSPRVEVSFAMLDTCANGLARLLPEVPPESTIAVLAAPSPALIVAICAALKLGAACLWLRPGAPLPRSSVRFALSDRAWAEAERAGWEVFDLRAALVAVVRGSPSPGVDRQVDVNHASLAGEDAMMSFLMPLLSGSTLDLPPDEAVDDEAAARPSLEARLLHEWEQILDRPAVNVETGFLEAGGDSFAIAQFNLRIRRLLGVELPLLDMFRFPSIRQLARHLAGGTERAS